MAIAPSAFGTAAPERQYLASLRSGLWDLLANDYAATYLDASFVAAISARRRNVGWMRDIRGSARWSRSIIASNRLASTIKFASVLTTDSRNGANRRVPAIGASAISISRPSERYLTSKIFARWPAIGS